MASLKSVKNRKDIVLTIKKITKAMELVATSKIKKAKRNCDSISQYCLRIEEAFNNLNLNIKKWSDIISINPSQPKAFIVITSDLGMCGAYNSNILKLAKTKVSEQDYLFIIGSKGIKIFRKHFNKDKIILSFENVGDEPNYDIVDAIVDKVFPMLLNSTISSIQILSTKFINSITYHTECKSLFPFEPKSDTKLDTQQFFNKNIEFEPNPQTVIKKALPLYFGAMIYFAIAFSKISEMASRKMAMENSSNNATEIINELEKQYNKIRQSKITQEITEIVAGAQNE